MMLVLNTMQSLTFCLTMTRGLFKEFVMNTYVLRKNTMMMILNDVRTVRISLRIVKNATLMSVENVKRVTNLKTAIVLKSLVNDTAENRICQNMFPHCA